MRISKTSSSLKTDSALNGTDLKGGAQKLLLKIMLRKQMHINVSYLTCYLKKSTKANKEELSES